MRFYGAALIGLITLTACGTPEPVIADIGQDKVQVQGNLAKPEKIQAAADQGCGMYNRIAKPISYRCGDQYCIQKIYLYACMPKPGQGPDSPQKSS